MTIKTKEVERLMKQCQIGVGGKDALNKAHNIMADCYGTLGALVQERDKLQAELAKYRDAVAAIEQGCEDSNSAMMGTLSTTWIMKMINPLIVKPGE